MTGSAQTAILFDLTTWDLVHAMAISLPGKKGGGGIPPTLSILNQALRFWQVFVHTCPHLSTVCIYFRVKSVDKVHSLYLLQFTQV